MRHELYSPRHFLEAISKASGKTALVYEFFPLIRNEMIYGTQGFVYNPENNYTVYICSDQESPFRSQIAYKYVRGRDSESGGLTRHGSTPESIAPEVVRMLRETNKGQVDFEINFRKEKKYA